MNGNKDFGESLDGLAIAKKGVIFTPKVNSRNGRVKVQNWKLLLRFIKEKRRRRRKEGRKENSVPLQSTVQQLLFECFIHGQS